MKHLKRSLASVALAAFFGGILLFIPFASALTQSLTVTGNGAVISGWGAEGGDCTRISSDDGDTTRLYSPTATDIRVCALTNPSIPSGSTINSVTVTAKVRSLDPVSNTFKICVRTASTNYCSATKDTNPTTTYQTITEIWATNPNTSAAWTTAQLDALEAGLEKTNGVGMGWTYMIVDVDYTEGGGGGAAPADPPLVMWYF